MIIYLVRHGKDDDSIRDGWSNHELASSGVEQVNKLASEMVASNMSIDYIYSSDLQRTKETAEILSNYLGCSVECNAGLRETNNGDLAGMKHEFSNKERHFSVPNAKLIPIEIN